MSGGIDDGYGDGLDRTTRLRAATIIMSTPTIDTPSMIIKWFLQDVKQAVMVVNNTREEAKKLRLEIFELCRIIPEFVPELVSRKRALPLPEWPESNPKGKRYKEEQAHQWSNKWNAKVKRE